EFFKEIIQAYQARIRAYIAGLGVPVDTVDDLAQETFIQYYNASEDKPQDAEILPWLKGIARNISFNYFRSSKRMKHYHMKAAEMLNNTKSSIEEEQEKSDVATVLHTCIEELAPKSREMVEMKYNNSLQSDRIAEKIGSTAEAIRMSLVRIRKALKKCIENKIGGEVRYES
ncbi:RNA polymerase sigma factor, partial [Planctomycetota bacterium]